MAYLQELRKKYSDLSDLPVSEVQILGRDLCVIAGHKGLYSVRENEIVIRRRDGRVLVRGNGLRVQDADEGEIRLRGEICSVEFLSE